MDRLSRWGGVEGDDGRGGTVKERERERGREQPEVLATVLQCLL